MEAPLQPPMAAGPSGMSVDAASLEQVAMMGGGGDASSSMGRGSSRGPRSINPELLQTRPSNLVLKQGLYSNILYLIVYILFNAISESIDN